MKSITVQRTDHGSIYAYGPVAFHAQGIGFGDPELTDQLDALVATRASMTERFQENRIGEELREEMWRPVVKIAARNALDAALAEKRQAAQRGEEHEQPALSISDAFATSVWSTFRAASEAGQARLIQDADLADFTALRHMGRHNVPLNETLWTEVLRRYRVENRLTASGIAAQFPATPSLDHPLAIGADMDAARAQVERWEASHAERLEAVEQNEKTARRLIEFLAAVFEVQPAEILATMTGQKVDAAA